MKQLLFFYLLTGSFILLPIIWLLTDYRSFSDRLHWYLNIKRIVRHVLILLLFFIQYVLIVKYPFIKIPGDILVTILGLSLYTVGMFLAIIAKLTMRSLWGTPIQHDIKRQHSLLTQGVYSISRNPIYFGDLLVCIGYFLALHSYLVVFSMPLWLMIDTVIKKEEKILAKHFGEKYFLYKRKVRRYI